MIASIITPEDIRSAFVFVIVVTSSLALIPLCRMKSYSVSVNISLFVYSFFALWSWFICSDAKSSACPEYGAYLLPLFAALLGLIYLIAHTSFDSKLWKQKSAIGLLCIWMVFVSDWGVISEVVQAYE